MQTSKLKIAGAILLAFIVVWVLVFGWWQADNHQPSVADLGLYLGLLPSSLVGGFWLLHGFIEQLRAPAAEPAAPADSDPFAHSARLAAEERGYTMDLIGMAVAAAPGASVEDILDAVAAGRRPELDADLRDDDGFPVFTARVGSLDLEAFGDKLAAAAGTLPGCFKHDEQLRALALIDATLPALLAEAGTLLDRAGPPARLRLFWLIPADWEAGHLPALQAWLRAEYLHDLGKAHVEVALRQVVDDVDALMQIDELIQAAGRTPAEGELNLVFGAHSAIGDKTIQAWTARSRLFGADRQGGQIPGECGVGLLFAAGCGAPVERRLRISRIGSAVRDKPADAGGRINGALIEQLASGLLTVHGLAPAAIKAIVADCDHRESRVGELLRAAGEQFEELDPMTSCPRLGSACGTLSPLGGLLTLACAAGKAAAEAGPVICVSNQHPSARAALMVAPVPSPVDGAVVS
jgi:hypothetical protein